MTIDPKLIKALNKPIKKKDKQDAESDFRAVPDSLSQADYIITALPGPVRISLIALFMEKFIKESKTVWHLVPSEAVALHQSFQLRSALDESCVSTLNEKSGAPATLMTFDQLVNRLGEMDSPSLPDVVIFDGLELLGHPETGKSAELLLLALPKSIPMILLTGPAGNTGQICRWLSQYRNRPSRHLLYPGDETGIIPAFITSDFDLLPLADRRKVNKKVKQQVKEGKGIANLYSPAFINSLMDLLTGEKLTPALVIMPSGVLCDHAVRECRKRGDLAGEVMTRPGMVSFFEAHPELKDHPLLSEVIGNRAAPFHPGHSSLWLRLVSHLAALNDIDVLLATPESIPDLRNRMKTIVLVEDKEFSRQSSPELQAWTIAQAARLLSHDPEGANNLFALMHTPDADPVKLRDSLPDDTYRLTGNFQCTVRTVLGLLSIPSPRFLKNLNCSLSGYQYPAGDSPSVEELDAGIMTFLPQAQCAGHLWTVKSLIDLRLHLGVRRDRFENAKSRPNRKAQWEQRQAGLMLKCLPCGECPHAALCHKRSAKQFRAIIETYDAHLTSGRRDIEDLRISAMPYLEALRASGLANEAEELTPAGQTALKTGLSNPIPLFTWLRRDNPADMDPDLLFCLIGGFVFKAEKQPAFVSETLSGYLRPMMDAYNSRITPALEAALKQTLHFGVAAPEYALLAAAALAAWQQNDDVDRVCRETGFLTGDFTRLLRRTLAIHKQVLGNQALFAETDFEPIS